jgi:hypothetical protein
MVAVLSNVAGVIFREFSVLITSAPNALMASSINSLSREISGFFKIDSPVAMAESKISLFVSDLEPGMVSVPAIGPLAVGEENKFEVISY